MIANLREWVDLTALNTLALPARARYFFRLEALEQLPQLIAWVRAEKLPLLVLGGGSNVVLNGDWLGLVLQIALQGKSLTPHGDDMLVAVAAGENWHALVQWSLGRQLYGLENLTLIPGTVGAAPIQNIGAYGVELAQVLESVRGFSLLDNKFVEMKVDDCRLGYRDSIFKHALRECFIVTEVVLRLRRQFVPVLSYPALHELQSVEGLSAARVEAFVRAMRQSKLPDPQVLPNAGSFFKNPVIDEALFTQLRATHPTLPSYAAPAGVKIPAAWLVERCGWKGRRHHNVGVHDQQALVLVHFAAHSGVDGPAIAAVGDKAVPGADHSEAAAQLLQLAAQIQADVWGKFGVALELEPVVYRSKES